jgi:hypothetical protein
MSDEPENSETRDADEIDLGEPISALAVLEHNVSRGLVKRIRRTINVRKTVGQLASFSVDVPLLALREFWSILSDQAHRTGTRKDASHEKKPS